MHEAGVAARALEAAVATAVADGRTAPPRAVEVMFDPVRVTEDSLRFHVELALRESGLGELPIVMSAAPVACPACGARAAGEAWPLCEACGAVIPAGTGPMAEARFEF